MTSSYERAGLTSAEVAHLVSLVSCAHSSDPSIPWIAVQRTDVLGVVAALDRLVDRAAADSVGPTCSAPATAEPAVLGPGEVSS